MENVYLPIKDVKLDPPLEDTPSCQYTASRMLIHRCGCILDFRNIWGFPSWCVDDGFMVIFTGGMSVGSREGLECLTH